MNNEPRQDTVDAPRTERWQAGREDSGSLRESIADAFTEAKQQRDEDRGWETDGRESLRQVEQRAGAPIRDVVNGYAYHHTVARNGEFAQVADTLIDYAVKNPGKTVAPPREKPSGEAPVYDHVKDAFATLKDAARYDPLRLVIRKLAPHQSEAQTAGEVNTFDKDLRADAVGTVARAGIQNGYIETPAAQAQQADRDQRMGAARTLIEEVRQVAPDYDRHEETIGDILESAEFVRGPSAQDNLLRALELAQRGYVPPAVQTARAQKAQQDHAAGARRAAVSLRSGGPEGGAVSGRGGSTGDVRSDIAAAWQQVRGGL